MNDALLEIVKNYLGYTWSDVEFDKKLSLMILNAVSDLDGKSGVKNDYTKSGRAQTLLVNRVMYENSGALDDFEKNYKSMIVAFINKAKVNKYVEAQEQSD